MIASYPITDNSLIDKEAEKAMEAAIEAIQSIRNVRAEYKVKPSCFIEARIYAGDLLDYFVDLSRVISPLARVQPLTILNRANRKTDNSKSSVLVLREAEIVLPWENMVNIVTEKERLTKEANIVQSRIDQLKQRLDNRVFLSKAPSQIVEKERAKLLSLNDKLERLVTESSQLG
jgi:valyl-tRNA synthetase